MERTKAIAIAAADAGWHLTRHCRMQAHLKGFDVYALLAAAGCPTVSYPHGSAHPGQYRHIRDGVVAVVDPDRRSIITAYLNVVETPLRADQLATA